MKRKTILLLHFMLFSILCFSQTDREFTEYDDALNHLKLISKEKGFKAVENKYNACKHLSSGTIQNIDEEVNTFLGRVDVAITWEYKYVGCYIGYHKYNGSAKVKASISKTSNGKFKLSERGVDVLRWDSEK